MTTHPKEMCGYIMVFRGMKTVHTPFANENYILHKLPGSVFAFGWARSYRSFIPGGDARLSPINRDKFLYTQKRRLLNLFPRVWHFKF